MSKLLGMLFRHHALLCQHKRFRYLLEKGVYVAARRTATEEVLLFQLRDAYVEVAFAQSVDAITWVKKFTDVNELAPYLQTIELPNFFDEDGG